MKRKLKLNFLVLALSCFVINGIVRSQSKSKESAEGIIPSADTTETLPLIPYPRQIVVLKSRFRPDAGTSIRVCSNGRQDYFAATQLKEVFSHLYALKVPVRKTQAGLENSIVLTHPGLNKLADARLKAAGLELERHFNPEGYVLLVDGQGVIVSAVSAAGLYYGVQTLRQLIYPSKRGCSIQGVAVRDWPAMRYRWQQVDWNRGPIPTLKYAEKQIKMISEYKMNGYCIYAENLFQSARFPCINSYGGTVDSSEISELVAYAEKYHVQIIPEQETFGHLHYILRQELYAGLGEKNGGQMLSPAEPGSYKFIEEYLSEIVPMFKSKFFHIGCDETFELGHGKSKELVKRSSYSDVYLSYLNKVAALPALKNKTLLFWGGIAEKSPEKLDLLPKNVVPVAWDYLPRDNYDALIKPYAERKIRTFVAPAAFYGGLVFPDYNSNLENIRNFVRDGQRYGSIGMLNTSWDDLGEDIFDMGWYGVVYAAACSWQPGESSERQFRDAFDWAFYRNGSGHQFADGIDKLSSIYEKAGKINCDMVYSNPFSRAGIAQQDRLQQLGISQLRRMRSSCEDAYTLFYQHKVDARIHRKTIDALLFGARRLDFVFHKALLAIKMSKLYDAIVRDHETGHSVEMPLYNLIMPYASCMGDLRDMTEGLLSFHKKLWNSEYRRFHWDVIDARYMRMFIDWENEYGRIQYDLNQFKITGKDLPRKEVGFLFNDL